jgi:hypothetical protein
MTSTDSGQPSIPLPDAPTSASRAPSDSRGESASPRNRTRSDAPGPRSSPGAGLVLAVLVLGLVLGGGGMRLIESLTKADTSVGATVDTTRYQSVILSNNKVYFGKLTSENDTFFRLDHAYFLRETQAAADAQPVRTLLPVNRELQAPENRMLIRKDAVVIVENLAKDSPLLKEIQRQEGGGK